MVERIKKFSFNLKIEILIIGRQTLAVMILLRMFSFNLRIEILIIGSPKSAADKNTCHAFQSQN